MDPLLDIVFAIAILSTLAMLGTRRLEACAYWIGFQGLAIGIMPVVLAQEHFSVRFAALVGGQLLLKGIVFPWLLLRQTRKAEVSHNPGSFIGFSGAVLLGLAALGLSSWLALRLGMTMASEIPFVTSFFLILAGLLLTIVRQKALMQVIGYLTLENGIYVFGSVAVIGTPLLVELGVLMDVFVAVFVMGLAIDYIHLQFANTDVGRLSRLRG